MKLRDATVFKGMTVNLGNYNSHKVEIGMSAVFDEDDDFEAGLESLTTLVNKKLAAEVNAIGKMPAAKKQTLMEAETDALAAANPIETDDERLERTGSYTS